MPLTCIFLPSESYWHKSWIETWICRDALFSPLKLMIPSKNIQCHTHRMTDHWNVPNLSRSAFSARLCPRPVGFRPLKKLFQWSSTIEFLWANWLRRPKTKNKKPPKSPKTEWNWEITSSELKEKSSGYQSEAGSHQAQELASSATRDKKLPKTKEETSTVLILMTPWVRMMSIYTIEKLCQKNNW